MWCNSDWLFFLPSQRQTFLQPQLSCMFDCITFHFYWVYSYKRSQRHIFMEENDFFLPSNYIPLRKAFFSVIVCIKYLLKIYLMAVIVWNIFKATAYLIFIDWSSFIIINVFLLNKLGICRTCHLLPIKYHFVGQANFIQISLSIPYSYSRFLVWHL